MDKLNIFYNDEHTRETVKAWITQCAEEWAISQLKADKEVTGFKVAMDVISDSFIKLDEKFGQKKASSKVNQAK